MPKTVNKPVIAVDIDEVLAPHFIDLMNWYNKTYGTHLTLANNHPADDDDYSPWGTDDMFTARRQVQKFFETPEFRNARPFAEAKQALKSLSKYYELVVITSRDYMVEKLTVDWLEEHFEGLFSDAHFTARYSVEGKGRTKVDAALEAGAQYLIEDGLEHAFEAAQGGIVVLLFGDYPWNQAEKLPDRVTRVADWQSVLEYFNGQR